MLRNRDIRQLQQILLMRKIVVYLLVLRYIQFLHELQGKEQENKIVSFAYDPFGRRISKSIHREEIDDDNDSDDEDDIEKPRAVYYVYDNEDIIMEYNHRGKVTARYTHGLGIDEPLSVEKKHNHTYYYHADGLGSIVSLSDERGKVIQTYDYDSFGNLKHHGHKVKQPYAYTGREYDSETKLYFYRARYYDAKVGRFLEKDPILHPANGLQKKTCNKTSIPSFKSLLKKPQNLNPYAYTTNNPINLVDPTGLACGPGTLGDLVVPDKFPSYDFTGCCQDHDSCYGCKGKTLGISKEICDQKFYDCLFSTCQRLDGDSKRSCEGNARFYYMAVKQFGGGSFRPSRKECCGATGTW